MSTALLLVEDDQAIAQFLQRALAADGRYQLEWQASGATAQVALRQRRNHGKQPYAAVLLDLGLPDRDGLELVPWFRKESPETVLMILSARGQEADKVQALQNGADDYLTKPFTLAELLARLHAHLRRSGVSLQQGPLQVGNWTLADQTRCLHIGEREICLTTKEYQLKRVLLRNAGAVLPHQRILSAVWGPAHADQTHYLRIYMQKLREKIEPDPNQPQYLTTEVGVGYRLVIASDLTDPLQKP